MSGSNDRLGGYTLEALLGSDPVLEVEKKQGVIAKIIGAPFRLIAALIKLPITAITKLARGVANVIAAVVKLPFRLLGALARPFKKKAAQ